MVVSASSAADGFSLSVSVVDCVLVAHAVPRSTEEMEGENEGGGGKEEEDDDAGRRAVEVSLLLLLLLLPALLSSSRGSACNGLR